MNKTSTGNYFYYFKGHYVFIYRRPHGKYCVRIGRKGEWLYQEGYFGTSLKTVAAAKKWAAQKITP